MNIIKCPDCNQTLSKKALSCPHCGRVMRQETRDLELFGFLAILAGIAYCFIDGIIGGLSIFIGFVLFIAGRFKA